MYDDYMNTEELAKFIGVKRHTVEKWRKKGWLMPDVIGHGKNGRGGVYYYSKEHVLQLASVYATRELQPNCNQSDYLNNDSDRTATAEIDNTEEDREIDEIPDVMPVVMPVDDDDDDDDELIDPPTEKTCVIDSPADFAPTKEDRIDEARRFFERLYGALPEKPRRFSYLWTKRGEKTKTYPFAVSDPAERMRMAEQAIKLSDEGHDVYYGINVTDAPCDSYKRAKADNVTALIASPTDIDVEGGTHISEAGKKIYPASFVGAKSLLPFAPSILVNSGYGLHGLLIYDKPLELPDKNSRDEAKARNDKFIGVISTRATERGFSGCVDSVGDLPRILRVPGTRNYKLGISDNAPLCRFVEDTGITFTIADIDARLETLTPRALPVKPARQEEPFVPFADETEYDLWRAERMLDSIDPAPLGYNDWFLVLSAAKGTGLPESIVDAWCQRDPNRYTEKENHTSWEGSKPQSDIRALYNLATKFGNFSEKDARREWYQLHPELSQKNSKARADVNIDALEADLRSANKAIADFDAQKEAALEKLRAVEVFDSETVFSEEIIEAAAFAKLFDRATLSAFRRDVKNYGDKHKDKKVPVYDWLAEVNARFADLKNRKADLTTRRNVIQAQINSLSFVGKHAALKDSTIPQGYSISETSGITKVEGEKPIPVCSRPVIITGKTFSVDEKIYKLSLSFMTTDGKWKELSPTEKAVVFNKNKLVDLANDDLPVTTSNATHLVDYLYAFCACNETKLPLTLCVSRCGWYNFDGKNYFIDPRRPCVITNANENFSVKVDSRSEFSRHLKQVGSLDEWKTVYGLAKKSPVARLIVAAAVAPILLDVLGERNFLLYIYAPTRAGKTTALCLGASAIGDEKIIRSFDATKNGLAGAAADVNDYAFLVDEKQVADNYLKDQFNNLVYALGNGIGRTKLNKDSTLKKLQDWRTIAIMTGETQMLSDNVTGGANTRLLTIKAPKEILPADVCKIIRDTIKTNHGLALPAVVDKVLEIGRDTLTQMFDGMASAFEAKFKDILPEYRRYMAVLTLADGLLNSVLFGDTATAPDGKTIKPSDDAILNAAKIFPLIPTLAEIDDTPREKEFVCSFIAQNQGYFFGGPKSEKYMQAVYGKLNDPDGFTYITAQALKDACADSGFDYRKLVADLIADGFFKAADTTMKGRKTPPDTVQKRLGNVNARCYRIPQCRLDEAE